MKLVGEAVASELHKYNTKVTVLGIATWGVVKYRDSLVNPVGFNTKNTILILILSR